MNLLQSGRDATPKFSRTPETKPRKIAALPKEAKVVKHGASVLQDESTIEDRSYNVDQLVDACAASKSPASDTSWRLLPTLPPKKVLFSASMTRLQCATASKAKVRYPSLTRET